MTSAHAACESCGDTSLLPPDLEACGCRGLGAQAAQLSQYWAEPYAIPRDEGAPLPLRRAQAFSAVADTDGRVYPCTTCCEFMQQRRSDLPARLSRR